MLLDQVVLSLLRVLLLAVLDQAVLSIFVLELLHLVNLVL
jgi:hypothetical protein